MTILQALASLYDRLLERGEVPPPGYSLERIGGVVTVDHEGRVCAMDRLGAADERGNWRPQEMFVPAAVRRTVNIAPNLFWDKTAYALGVTNVGDATTPQPGQGKRTPKENEAFITEHQALLASAEDEGLIAFRRFLERWRSEDFERGGFPPELLDQHIVFHLQGDHKEDGTPRYVHERPAAREIVLNARQDTAGEATCLVSGEHAPVARLHPAIKGVKGGQSSGTALVSFNLDAFTSYGKEQGANAPVSVERAFAYVTALNHLLSKAIYIGDTATVFWAEVPDARQAEEVDQWLFQAFDPPDEESERNKLEAFIRDVAQGRGGEKPVFDPETRVYILGLAPNAARLSVRFWRPGTLGDFARNVLRFWEELALKPPPWRGPPSIWAIVNETAILDEKNRPRRETIPARLGGDLMRSVLSGAPYPVTLLSMLIGRIRADKRITPPRVAIIAAWLRRNARENVPMSLDRTNPDPAYRLGRLFAILEYTQEEALGKQLNATIKDRYFAAAAASPARIFPILMKTARHHHSSIRKSGKLKLARWLDNEMNEIINGLPSDWPRSLNLVEQGRFITGYFHQRSWRKEQDADDESAAKEEIST